MAQTGDGGAEVYVFGNSLVHHLGDEAHSNVPYWLAQMADAGGRELSLEGQWGFLRDFAGGLPPQHARQDLPLENLGYQYYVGDYHPPLGGFLLLAMALALMVAVHQAPTAAQRDRRLAALAAEESDSPGEGWVQSVRLTEEGLEVVVLLPHGADAPEAVRFPQPVTVEVDGEIAVPG